MAKVISHHDDLKPDYPTFSQFQSAASVLVSYLRGGGDRPTAAVVGKCAWVALGFAESFIPENEPPPVVGGEPPPDSGEDKARLLEEAVAAAGPAAKGAKALPFDWRALARLVLAILAQVLGA